MYFSTQLQRSLLGEHGLVSHPALEAEAHWWARVGIAGLAAATEGVVTRNSSVSSKLVSAFPRLHFSDSRVQGGWKMSVVSTFQSSCSPGVSPSVFSRSH